MVGLVYVAASWFIFMEEGNWYAVSNESVIFENNCNYYLILNYRPTEL